MTPDPSDSSESEAICTVSALTQKIADLLENEIPPLWIEGEISNFKPAASGHFYFTLKDEKSQISAVMFRFSSQALKFSPENGMKVQCFGAISVYQPRGQYQIKVTRMKPAGVGELQLAFEQLKRKLEDEGLFDPARRRPIPFLPRRVGIVTSGTGAAIRDIITVLTRRYPRLGIIIYPTRVQGDGAASEIAAGIAALNQRVSEPIDVLIVGRGGGSIEDLWAFNEEIVARAIAGSRIPIISAVGHEIDFTIADFVADLRAPTPSAAAELAIPDRQELERRITQCSVRLIRSLENRARRMRREVDREIRTLIGRPRAMIEERAQLVDELVARSVRAVRSLVRYRRESFRAALNRLEPLSPLRILARGYSLTTTEDDCPVTDASMVKKGSRIIVQFGKGQALCRVLAKGDNLKTPRGIQNKLPGIDSKATRLSVNGASTTGENPNE